MAGIRFQAERIFDGWDWHDNAVMTVKDGYVESIKPADPSQSARMLDGWIVPGLVDLQVNGGGGVLFNNDPTPEGLAQICTAHAGLGTTAVMATLITDRPEITASAISAAISAVGQPGMMGLHLEGPHLDFRRKGTHDPALIRRMEDPDMSVLLNAASALPYLICTVAPESVTAAQIAALADAGVVVSLGHSDCTAAEACASFDAGAHMVTHLFNAMSQLGHRTPGLVGVALDDGRVSAGLIADGFHADDIAMRVALRAKQGPGRIFLVSDAMSTIGTDLPGFTLNGRQIYRRGGRLTLADGTLAGADIAQIDALRYVHKVLNVPLAEALRLAAFYPAQAAGASDRGHLRPGSRADFLTLTPEITAESVWIGGCMFAGGKA